MAKNEIHNLEINYNNIAKVKKQIRLYNKLEEISAGALLLGVTDMSYSLLSGANTTHQINNLIFFPGLVVALGSVFSNLALGHKVFKLKRDNLITDFEDEEKKEDTKTR
ncbi:MAG TPA: hypothetical protein PLB45_04680 [Bacilli bacterium]|nr:hypothetical protein [Bacilli bacterium]HPZ23903.1 hypothetical protein [Bacilli bacterium]HQC84141.1 hypothetical protein [Bacilli bacterium]